MEITIATVAFNQGSFLAECIESVLSQGVSGLEYIVVDAGSTDQTADILRSHSSGISLLIREPDDGPADGLNKAFAKGNGEIFGYLNADDCYLPGALDAVRKAFGARPWADVLYGDGIQIDQLGARRRDLLSDPWSVGAYARGATTVVQQATFFRRSAFLRTGGFNAANRTCWDGELLVRLSKANARFSHICRQLGAFRIHPDSISGSGRLNQQYREDRRRVFQEVFGRRPRPLDRLLGSVLAWPYRLHRHLVHWPVRVSRPIAGIPGNP
jgi:glycosyltransferase involved in cell wall biosynthesis